LGYIVHLSSETYQQDCFKMRTTISLSVILVAAILALGDGASVGEDSRYAQRGKMAMHRVNL